MPTTKLVHGFFSRLWPVFLTSRSTRDRRWGGLGHRDLSSADHRMEQRIYVLPLRPLPVLAMASMREAISGAESIMARVKWKTRTC
jgi:hypothetical protein